MFSQLFSSDSKSSKPKFIPIHQGTIGKIYNYLVDKLQDKFPKRVFKKLNEEGVCAGLSLCFVLYTRDRQKEFRQCLQFIRSLSPPIDKNDDTLRINVENLVNHYEKAIHGKKILYVQLEDSETLNFEKVIQFLEAVSIAQNNQNLKTIRINWDKTYSFCSYTKEGIHAQLIQAKILPDDILIVNWAGFLGYHALCIENKEGFSFFEPNNIDEYAFFRKLKNEEALAIRLSQSNGRVFTLRTVSYADKNKNRSFDYILADYAYKSYLIHCDDLDAEKLEKRVRDLKLKGNACVYVITPHDALYYFCMEDSQIKYHEQMIAKSNSLLNFEGIIRHLRELPHKETPQELPQKKIELLISVANHNPPERKIMSLIFQYRVKGTISCLDLALALNEIIFAIKKAGHCSPMLHRFAKHIRTYIALKTQTPDGNRLIEKMISSCKNEATMGYLLSQASSYNQVTLVKRILNKIDPKFIKVIINSPFSRYKFTALQNAAEYGNTEIVSLLLAHGANPNLINNPDGYAILTLTVLKDNIEVVGLLLEYGANPNFITKDGHTSLYIAAENDNVEIIELLLAYGADPNLVNVKNGWPPLHLAVSRGNIRSIRSLLAYNANPNSLTQCGYTSLCIAATAQNDNVEIIELLLAHGADPHLANVENNWTPLHLAIDMENIKNIKSLLAHGANPNSTSVKTRITPFHMAVKRGNEEVVNLLLKYGASLDLSFHISVKLLLKQAKNQNSQPQFRDLLQDIYDGQIPEYIPEFNALQLAICFGHIKIVRQLLHNGFNFSNPSNGLSALDLANAMDYQDIAMLLPTLKSAPNSGLQM
jgi:uncharacterized protein